MNIITNNRPRPLLALIDLPEKARADFDYVKDGAEFYPSFVQYKGVWYDVADSQSIRTGPGAPMGWAYTVEKDSPFADWDGIMSDSFFSGVLFKWANDYDVIVGRYYS